MTDSERSSSPNESRFEDWLAKSLHRITCPDTLELGEYAVGLLNSTAAAMLDKHLYTCPKCREEVNFLRGFMAAEEVQQAASNSTENLITKVRRRLVATLQKPDSMGFGGQMAVGALRGTVGDQLVYVVDAVQIVIDIQRDPGNPNLFVIHGLVLGLDNEDLVQVNLSQDNNAASSTVVDEIGNFSFDSLKKGQYALLLQSHALEIVIQELRIE